MNNFNNSREEWHIALKKAVGSKKSYHPDQILSFSNIIFDNWEYAVNHAEMEFPDNNVVQEIGDHVKKISESLTALENKFSDCPFFRVLQWDASTKREDDGEVVTFKGLRRFVTILETGITYQKSLIRPGRNNKRALYFAEDICSAYKICFNEEPTIERERTPYSPTPFERICEAICQLTNQEIPWTTQSQAIETYKKYLPDAS